MMYISTQMIQKHAFPSNRFRWRFHTFSTENTRLLRFWEVKNVKKGMYVDMVLIDSLRLSKGQSTSTILTLSRISCKKGSAYELRVLDIA
ncbi:hypothetical protein Bca4012_090600 [Brassica carinata]